MSRSRIPMDGTSRCGIPAATGDDPCPTAPESLVAARGLADTRSMLAVVSSRWPRSLRVSRRWRARADPGDRLAQGIPATDLLRRYRQTNLLRCHRGEHKTDRTADHGRAARSGMPQRAWLTAPCAVTRAHQPSEATSDRLRLPSATSDEVASPPLTEPSHAADHARRSLPEGDADPCLAISRPGCCLPRVWWPWSGEPGYRALPSPLREHVASRHHVPADRSTSRRATTQIRTPTQTC